MTDIQARNSNASLQNSVHDPSDALSVGSTPQSNEVVSDQTTGEKLSGGITTEQQLKSMQAQLYSFLNDSEQSLLIGQNRENSSQGASRDIDGGLINTGCPGSCHGTMPSDASTTEDDAAFVRELLIDSTLGMTLAGGLALSGYQVLTNPNPFSVGEFITEVIPGPNLLKHTRNADGVATAIDTPDKINMRSAEDLRGIEPASSELISAVSKKRDVVIAQPGSEELRMLDYFGAEASVGGANNTHILLRENSSKAALLEEFLHGTQSKLGITDRLGTSGLGSAETHVKDFMIKHRDMLRLGDEDVKILQILRDKGL